MISGQTLRVCPEGKPVPTHRVVARGHAFPDHALEFRIRTAFHLTECDARKNHTHDAQRALSSVPGDARKRLQIGSAFGLDHARYRRHRAGEAGLLGDPDMLPAKRTAIARPIAISRKASTSLRLDRTG